MLYKPEYKAPPLFSLGYLETSFKKFRKYDENINKVYNATNSDACIRTMRVKEQCRSMATTY
jgi:hypothetical protein